MDVFRSSSVPELNTTALASKVAVAFMSGNVDTFTAAWLKRLFPAAQLVSLSVLAGGRLLISAENLLQPGYFRVSFGKVDDTVAGSALVVNRPFYAQKPAGRHSLYTDLQRANQQHASGSLIAVPISQRQRRVSLDQASYQPPSLDGPRRSSASEDNKDNAQRRLGGARWDGHRGPPVGALSLALPQGCMLTSLHLQNLTDLAEALSPLIARFCTGAATDMTSVFCSPPQSMVSDESDRHSQSTVSDIGEWMLSPEDLVDQLLSGGTAAVHTQNVHAAIASNHCVNLLTPSPALCMGTARSH